MQIRLRVGPSSLCVNISRKRSYFRFLKSVVSKDDISFSQSVWSRRKSCLFSFLRSSYFTVRNSLRNLFVYRLPDAQGAMQYVKGHILLPSVVIKQDCCHFQQ